MPAALLAAIVSRSLATALTRTVKLFCPAFLGSLRKLVAVSRMLRAAASRLDLESALTAVFHWLIAALLLLLAVLQAATGSVFGALLLLDVAELDLPALDLPELDLPELDFDAFEADELALLETELLVELLVELLDVVDAAVVADDPASDELPPEQALSATRLHAAAATTLSRRTWAWVVRIRTECPSPLSLAKSRDAGHAPADSALREVIAGCASTHDRTLSATQSG